jgi:hypothetical protein
VTKGTNGGVSYREAVDMPLFEMNMLIEELERIGREESKAARVKRRR